MGSGAGPELTPGAGEDLRCARHPAVSTVLRCGRCDTPICPRCLVQGPVGSRCPDCARVRGLPTFDVKPSYLLRGLGAALGSGFAVGIVWGYFAGATRFAGIFVFFIALGIGWAVGEATSAATNRKRSPLLQACAVAGVVLAYLVHNTVSGLPLLPAGDLWGFIATGLAAFFAAQRLQR